MPGAGVLQPGCGGGDRAPEPGRGVFREVLRQVLRARADPESGRSWTAVQELVCRCAFKAVVTTNYDPGIVNARMRVRPDAAATGFTTWEDELGLDRWRTGDVFGEDELPVLFAHGQHNRPDTVVLAATEYRRAYAGKLPHVLARLMDRAPVLDRVQFRRPADRRDLAGDRRADRDPERTRAPRRGMWRSWPGTRTRRGMTRRSWRSGRRSNTAPSSSSTPPPAGTIPRWRALLADLADPRFPAAVDVPARPAPAAAGPGRRRGGSGAGVAVRWVPPPEPVAHFTGRAEELARLDRWAADPQVTAGRGECVGRGGEDRPGHPLGPGGGRGRAAGGAAGGVRVELLHRPLP